MFLFWLKVKVKLGKRDVCGSAGWLADVAEKHTKIEKGRASGKFMVGYKTVAKVVI